MSWMQTISRALSLALRLVVALALFGLSAAQANAALHGKLCASEIHASAGQHSHTQSALLAAHGSDGHSHDHAGSGHGPLIDTGYADHSDCCKSFCSSVALLEGTSAKSQFYGKARLDACIVQQLEAAAEAAIFTPPNM